MFYDIIALNRIYLCTNKYLFVAYHWDLFTNESERVVYELKYVVLIRYLKCAFMIQNINFKCKMVCCAKQNCYFCVNVMQRNKNKKAEKMLHTLQLHLLKEMEHILGCLYNMQIQR